MDNIPGRVTDEELRYDREVGGNVRDITVTIPADEFDGAGQQFESGEKVMVITDPVEQAIEDVRENNNA